MNASANVAPVIIKRKKVVAAEGHHGGAWKVAYADFVTAMMAFFMLMWLLSATTEQQRNGIADYFSPTIPLSQVSGGGDGAFGGDNMMSEDTLPQTGNGASMTHPTEARQARGATGVTAGKSDSSGTEDDLTAVEEALMGRGGERMVTDEMLKHIVTRVTDEGLIIEVFDRDGAPLFDEGTDQPTPMLTDIAAMIARVSQLVRNDLSVGGHIRAHPIVLARNPVWELSALRADRMRTLLEQSGLPSERMRRVTGHADRTLAARDPMSNRNNRREVILLRR